MNAHEQPAKKYAPRRTLRPGRLLRRPQVPEPTATTWPPAIAPRGNRLAADFTHVPVHADGPVRAPEFGARAYPLGRPRPAGEPLRRSQVPEPAATTGLTGSSSPPTVRAQHHPQPVPDLLRGSGEPLAGPLKEEMEARLGADFSGVRVHTGPAARASAAELGARAYTFGSHVVIGDGGAGKRTLAHELTHVVQQRIGDVTSGFQHAGVGVSDPADPFEREADAVAARVVSESPVGTDPVSSAAGSSVQPAARGEETRDGASGKDMHGRTAGPAVPRGRPVVQRKVGFEFETGWLVDKKGLFRPGPLKKKEPVGTRKYEGFKLEADEAGDGKSEIEFIVDPPVEEGSVGLQELRLVMGTMTALGEVLEAQAKQAKPEKQAEQAEQAKPATFGLERATGDTGDTKFIVTPTPDGQLEAGPQVTSGLDLAKIGQLSQQPQSAPQPPAELAPTLATLTRDALALSGLNSPASTGGEKISPEMQGLLTVVTQYLEVGADRHKGRALDPAEKHLVALNYPKRVADVLLARTSFAGLFTLLPAPERNFYTKNRDAFVLLALHALPPKLGIGGEDPVFARGIQVDEEDPAKGIVIPKLTVKDWLGGIPSGKDLMTKVPDAESMGEFGSKTEKIGPAAPGGDEKTRKDAGIFEFRGAQATKIPLARWSQFATEFLAFITSVHGGNG